MKPNRTTDLSSRLIFILLFSLPLAILFFLPNGEIIAGAWFWIALMICFLLIWTIIGIPRNEETEVTETRSRMIHESDQPESIKEVMEVHVATQHDGIQAFQGSLRVSAAVAFDSLSKTLGLLAILGIHEMGHYFAARRRGIDVTPPFFIPIPFALGTFGAFIKMRSPAQNRLHRTDSRSSMWLSPDLLPG